MFKVNYTLLPLTVIACLVFTSRADAQCVMAGDTAWEFRVSNAVFIGTVLTNRPTGEIGHHVLSDIGTLRVEQMWKGSDSAGRYKQSRTLEVKADAPFEVGKRYLVFANGDPLSTSIECNWTLLEDASEKKLKWLNSQ